MTAVAFTTRLPVQPGGSTTTVVEDYTPPAGTESVELPFALVSDDDFRTVGLRVTAGRAFDRQDALGTIPVVLVNETVARRFWDNTNPVGRRVRPQGKPDGWGMEVAANYTANQYHAPSDEFSDDFVFSGAVQQGWLILATALDIARDDTWPNWLEDSEFRAARDAMRPGG